MQPLTCKALAVSPPEVAAPLEQVQIDYTVIDLIIVDEHYRQPIGRACLAIAVDVFTLCVPGMVVTLEAPSADSVAFVVPTLPAITSRGWKFWTWKWIGR